MNIIITLVSGILIGWGSTIAGGTDRRNELIMNIVVGSVGAYLGGWILTSVYDSVGPGSLSFGVVVAAMLGASTALVVVNRIRDA